MKADMLPNGLIALSPVDSRNRARGLCRYIMQDGVIKAEVSASQLASNEEYIAIIWTGSRPQTLGVMHKAQEGCMVSGEIPGKIVDAVLIAQKEAEGIRITLAGRPLGSKLNMNEMLSKVRMHYYRKQDGRNESQKEKEPMPHRQNEIKLPGLKPDAVPMQEKAEHARMNPPLEPLGCDSPAAPNPVAGPENAPKMKLPQTPLGYYQPAAPALAAVSGNMPKVKLPQAPYPVAPEATSEALGEILKRADTLFAPKMTASDDMEMPYGLDAMKKREQWQNEVELLTDGMDVVDYIDADSTASNLPPALDRFVRSQNPRSITPGPKMTQVKPELEPEEEISVTGQKKVNANNRQNPNNLLRYTKPSYSKPITTPFQGKYPGATWVLARYPGTQYPHYLAGQWKRNNRNLLVIAVPGDYAPHPPSWLKGFTRHRVSHWGQGYWICITDYETGKLWEG